MTQPIDCHQFLNIPEARAIEKITNLGLRYRLVERNGKKFMITRDIQSDRVNLGISGGIVNLAYIG